MYSIKRNIEDVIKQRSANNKAILLTGPRQVGKSTLFKHLFSKIYFIIKQQPLLPLYLIPESFQYP